MNLFLDWNRFGEIEHYITCSPLDPLQRMGAVRIRVQKADKNFTIIHKSIIHNNASSHGKVYLLLSSRNPLTYMFRSVLDCFTCKQYLICAYFFPDPDEAISFIYFFIFLQKKQYYRHRTRNFSWKQGFAVKNILMNFSITNKKLFTSQDIN